MNFFINIFGAYSFFALGIITAIPLGLAARNGRFCSLGAVEDLVYGGRYYRALMWPSAIGWSWIGIALSIWFLDFNISNTIYNQVDVNWIAIIMGGLTFGFGMALTGMCGFTALANLAQGNMRALIIILTLGIFAMITARGPLAEFRISFFDFPSRVSGAPIYEFISKPNLPWLFLGAGILCVALPLLRRNFRHSWYPLWALVVAIAIVTAFLGTQHLNTELMTANVARSHTYSLPPGQTLMYIMTASGTLPDFGVGSVVGVILGSFLGSLYLQEFSWEACDDARELRRHLLGASLMGIGAVVSFGCSIGQGLSAMSIGFIGAPLAIISIAIGAYIGLKFLVEG